MKIFRKERPDDNHRQIYFFGIKIITYRKRTRICVSQFKSDILKHKAFVDCNNIKTIILGSSHGRDGYIPEKTSFNLANSSQDLYRAYKVYEYLTKNDKKCKILKNIILFWSVFHPGLQLEKTKEYLKCIPYKVFYNADYPVPFPISDEKYIKKLQKLYKKTKYPDNYRGKSFYDVNHDGEITEQLIKKHIKNTKRNNNQIQYVEKILNLAHKYNHKLYIVLPHTDKII